MRKSSFSGGNLKKHKSVTFADDIGKQLCTIQLYKSNETYTLLWDQSFDNINNTNYNGHKINEYSQQKSPLVRSKSAPVSNTDNNNNNSNTSLLRHGICALSQPYRNWIILFDTNSLVFNPAIHIVKLTKINVIVINGIPKVCGMITVKNLTYDKAVFVRYTFYEWKSHNDRYACFHVHDDAHNTDTFKFCIPLIISGNNSRNFEFAVCFETSNGGETYWDNNSGENYRIKYKSGSSGSRVVNSATTPPPPHSGNVLDKKPD